jgi:hypothetical protein
MLVLDELCTTLLACPRSMFLLRPATAPASFHICMLHHTQRSTCAALHTLAAATDWQPQTLQPQPSPAPPTCLAGAPLPPRRPPARLPRPHHHHQQGPASQRRSAASALPPPPRQSRPAAVSQGRPRWGSSGRPQPSGRLCRRLRAQTCWAGRRRTRPSRQLAARRLLLSLGCGSLQGAVQGRHNGWLGERRHGGGWPLDISASKNVSQIAACWQGFGCEQ